MKSLAEHLGISINAGEIGPGEPTDEELLSCSIKEFARGILRSRDYRRSILQRVHLGELPAQIEVLLYHYAEGKPVENIKVEDVTLVASLSAGELESRALHLASLARQLREDEERDSTVQSTEPAGPAGTSRIH